MTKKLTEVEALEGLTITAGPFPASRKVYTSGSVHPDLRVPHREITLSDTLEFGGVMTVVLP